MDAAPAAAVSPAGSATGEPGSSVRVPPSIVISATPWAAVSLMYRFWPSGVMVGSVPPTPPSSLTRVLPSSVRLPRWSIENRDTVPDPVLMANRCWPSGVIATQHGAFCRSANGDAPIEDSSPLPATSKADTVPTSLPTLCGLLTNSWLGLFGNGNELLGRKALPNAPSPCPVNGEPGAAWRWPRKSTWKLSIRELATSVPTRFVPSLLNSTSPRSFAAPGAFTVDFGNGTS